MIVSPGSVEDVPRVAALYRACFDDRVITVAGIRHRQVSAQPEDELRFWRAEEGGELIGWSFAGRDAFAAARTTGERGHRRPSGPSPSRSRLGALGGGLRPSRRDRRSSHRRVQPGRRPDSVAFVGARGFSLESTDTTSAVDPRTLPPPPEPPAGIAIAPMAEYEDDPTPVFEADKASAVDEPGPGDFSGITYETWRRLIWDAPDCDHDLSVVVTADGVVVGTSFLYSDRETGTRDERRYRRDPRLPRPGPRAPDEAALARAGGRLRDHEGDHPERRDQRTDARDQREARLRAAVIRARLGARALSLGPETANAL